MSDLGKPLERFTIYGLNGLEVRDQYRRNEAWHGSELVVDVELLADTGYMVLTIRKAGEDGTDGN